MKTMCPPGYHHNGFVATHALGHMMCRTSCAQVTLVTSNIGYIFPYWGRNIILSWKFILNFQILLQAEHVEEITTEKDLL